MSKYQSRNGPYYYVSKASLNFAHFGGTQLLPSYLAQLTNDIPEKAFQEDVELKLGQQFTLQHN